MGPPDESLRRPRKSDVIIGGSRYVRELHQQIAMVAPTDANVAISGESGTGKELVARTLHRLSLRLGKPFVVVNCAALPEGLLEDELFGHVRGAFTDASGEREGLFARADGGTLFLDEIGEMSLGLQAKLLRVLQHKEIRRIGDDKVRKVNFRLVTATNRDLEKAVELGNFRRDLYFRIHVVPIHLRPLRERSEDVPLLAQHFLLKYRAQSRKEQVDGFSEEAMATLVGYHYPGNIRELENIVQRALVICQEAVIPVQALRLAGPWKESSQEKAGEIDLSRPFRELKKDVVGDFERRYIEALLQACEGNVAKAARQSGMDRKNLWSIAQKYGISFDEFRAKETNAEDG